MDFNKQIMNTFTSFGYQYTKNFKKGTGMSYWHPGFAWACNRKAYDKMGGIFESGILCERDSSLKFVLCFGVPYVLSFHH